MSEIKTVTDAYNVFVARLISQTDQTQIGGFLEELKEAEVFEDRKSYTRLKKKIQEVATKANITVTSSGGGFRLLAGHYCQGLGIMA